MKKVLVSVIVLSLVVVIAIVLNLLSVRPTIKGRYIAFPNVVLRNIKVGFSVFDKKGQTSSMYTTRLDKEGGFSIKIREMGDHKVMLTNVGCPSYVFKEPFFSNDMQPYLCNLRKGEVVDLGNMYISEAIDIESPSNNKIFKFADEIVFKWSEIPFADFYTLNILKINTDGKEEQVVSSHKITPGIHYNKICKLEIVDNSKMLFGSIVKLGPFNSVFNSLGEGKYRISVIAYKILAEEKRLLIVGKTSNSIKTWFVIQNGN